MVVAAAVEFVVAELGPALGSLGLLPRPLLQSLLGSLVPVVVVVVDDAVALVVSTEHGYDCAQRMADVNALAVPDMATLTSCLNS